MIDKSNAKPKYKKPWWNLRRQETLAGYFFASPWIIGFILFTGGPILASLFLSFTKYEVFQVMGPSWIGARNYADIFINDENFWLVLYNTVYYTIFSVPLGLIGSLLIAVLMNQNMIGIAAFRTIYYLPSVVSGVAVAILWLWLFQTDFGLINLMLARFGIKGPPWLASVTWSKPALIVMSLWGIGGSMIIYLAGLQGIPTQLYEAAAIDGANWWHKFRHITLPMMTPVILFNLVMGMIRSFQVFTNAYVMTSGGPAKSTLFYVLYLYQTAFQMFRMGYSSALAWILFVIILILTLLIFKSSPLWVYYEGKRGR